MPLGRLTVRRPGRGGGATGDAHARTGVAAFAPRSSSGERAGACFCSPEERNGWLSKVERLLFLLGAPQPCGNGATFTAGLLGGGRAGGAPCLCCLCSFVPSAPLKDRGSWV